MSMPYNFGTSKYSSWVSHNQQSIKIKKDRNNIDTELVKSFWKKGKNLNGVKEYFGKIAGVILLSY